jgi:hypothetical protein
MRAIITFILIVATTQGALAVSVITNIVGFQTSTTNSTTNGSINAALNSIADQYSLSVGEYNSVNNYAMAVGCANYADWACLAVGDGNVSSGTASLVAGGQNEVWGAYYTMVTGYLNFVNGSDSCFVAGYANAIDNWSIGSIILGASNTAIDVEGAVLIGESNTTLEDDSILIGQNLTGDSQCVTVGKYNDPKEGKVFVVACGVSGTPANAIEVDNDGTVLLNGPVVLGERQGDISMGVYE